MCEILTSTSSEAFSGQNEMLYEIPEFTRLINTYNNQQIQNNQHSQQFPNQFQEHLTETTYNGESSAMTNNNIQSISSNNYPVNDHRQMRQEMVEHLVDTTKLIIDCIWMKFPVQPSAKVIPLRVFIQEILRRSRTSWSTLQTTLFYLVRMKPKIELLWLNSALSTSSDQQDQPNKPNDPATCGRRMFLASLIVASKYLQDRNYSNNAWSKICGLSVQDINAVERRFLMLIEYNLFIGEDVFKHWTNLLNSHIMTISRSSENTSGNNVTIKREDLKEDENQNATRFKQILWMQRPQTVECSVKG